MSKKLFDPLGLILKDKPDNSASDAASAASAAASNAVAESSAAQARAEQSRAAAEQATQNMKTNFATDLKQENVGTVVSGGTADTLDAANAADLLKKKKAMSLSSQLGINT